MQVFSIHVIALTIDPLPEAEVFIVQGHDFVVLTNETLVLETNGDRSAVYYNVTVPPGYGELQIDYLPVRSFSQADVDSGRVTYFQSDKGSASDEFEFHVRDAAHNEKGPFVMTVVVTPLIRSREDPVAVTGEGPFEITVDLLDASELAALTGADPVYNVNLLPQLGTLSVSADTGHHQRRRRHDSTKRQRTRRKRDGDEAIELDTKLQFSHDDVVNNRVTYTPDPDAAPDDNDGRPQEDVFLYTLNAPLVQPATGLLKFEVTLPPATEATAFIADDDHDEYHYVYVDNVEDDEEIGSEYVTTALIVAGGVLTSVCSIVSYRCYRLSRRRRWKRHQRQLEALEQDDDPALVKRHAGDLHPSEPLLTRSTWTEPMHVAASASELRRMRAEHLQTRRHINDMLRCAGVDSTGDNQPQASPGDGDQQQTLQRNSVIPGSPSPQSPQTFDRKGDLPPQSTWLDSFSGTRDDPTLDRQRGPPASSQGPPTLSRGTPTSSRGPVDTVDTIDQSSTQQQRPHQDLDRPTLPSSVPTSGLSDVLRPTTQRFTLPADRDAPETERDFSHAQKRERGDDACADGSHCGAAQHADVTREVGATRTLPGDDDGGYVTGPRPQRQTDDVDVSSDHSDEDGRAAAAQQVVYDWDKVDPQLLDLCRKTSPVLDKNQYWV